MFFSIRVVDARPEIKYLNRHVRGELSAACEDNPEAWKDLGVELLPPGDSSMAALKTISANSHGNVIKCCASMLSLWLKRQPEASWRQLIEALKVTGLDYIATDLEGKLIPQGKHASCMCMDMHDRRAKYLQEVYMYLYSYMQ